MRSRTASTTWSGWVSPTSRSTGSRGRSPAGEVAAVDLTTALGSSLVNALYVLDEPSIGLHPRDTARLMDVLQKLRDSDNTIVVVEHDSEVIRRCDRVIDLGPGAGERGGEIVFDGPTSELALAGSLAHRRVPPGGALDSAPGVETSAASPAAQSSSAARARTT